VSRLDAALLLMALIWGTNYAIVKSAFREIDPQAFNALRLLLASTVMALASRAARRLHLDEDFHTSARVTRDEWLRVIVVGLVGHGIYQYLFVGGLARTSVANGALIISLTPIVITLVSAIGGRERVGALHWAGSLLSLAGIYIVVGRGAHVSAASLRGDLMLMGAVVCWALYTIGARPLMVRHSPVGITALSMLLGTIGNLPLAAPGLAQIHWHAVSTLAWVKLVYSSLFAICVAYTIWCAAVREIRERPDVGLFQPAPDCRDDHRVFVAARADRTRQAGRRCLHPGRGGPDTDGAGAAPNPPIAGRFARTAPTGP
jgi:drug/metabolite transporter (DMT)-like permease